MLLFHINIVCCISKAIHSPPSLDLWSLARARRGGGSRAPHGAGVGLLLGGGASAWWRGFYFIIIFQDMRPDFST